MTTVARIRASVVILLVIPWMVSGCAGPRRPAESNDVSTGTTTGESSRSDDWPADQSVERSEDRSVDWTADQPAGRSADQSGNDLLIPGTFSEATSVSDLAARFGAENVVRIQETDDDGWVLHSVVLFPHDPTRRAYLRFHDNEALVGLAAFHVRDRESHWRGKLGVRVGMSFAELRALNGKPFGFAGFDRDGRGWVHDAWSLAVEGDDGGLGALDVAEGEYMYFGVELALRGGRAGLPPGAYPQDEYSVSSDDPRFPHLGETVEIVGFNATTSLDDEW